MPAATQARIRQVAHGFAMMTEAERKRRSLAWIVAGGAMIMLSAAFFLADIVDRGGIVVPRAPLPEPGSGAAAVGRLVAGEITPLFWGSWLLVLYGLRSLLLARRRVPPRPAARVATCFFASVPIWLVFDAYNFGFMGAWDYHGLAADPLHRYLGFFVAFGAICPAMFLTADILLLMRVVPERGRPVKVAPGWTAALVAIGLLCALFPIVAADPIGSVSLWLAFILLLDPINRRYGASSILGDLEAGRWGRPIALIAAAPLCGLLWEFWNYWATAKWTYDLSFLGPLENVRYFEMPLVGMLGYLPFGLECWAMFQTLRLVLARLGWVRMDPLPPDAAV